MDDYFRVQGKRNMFAIGDVTALAEDKLAFLAMGHAKILAKSLKRLIQLGPDAKLQPYKAGSFKAMAVSLGPNTMTGGVCLSFLCCVEIIHM